MEPNYNAVIVQEKESIVTRGIVKKLEEMAYEVTLCSTVFDDVEKKLDKADIFVLYLSPNIQDDLDALQKQIPIFTLLLDKEKYLILIGEKDKYEGLLKVVPMLGGCVWLDRPLVMGDLVHSVLEAERKLKEKAEAPDKAALEDLASEAEAILQESITGKPVKRILIVDDDPQYATMVKDWLKGEFKVDIVTAGMQAITFLLKKEVDLILLDYEMPIVDGSQVLGMLRSEPQVAHIPVIFLTGIGDAESVKKVMSLKPRGYILKSTSKADLIAYIKDHM
jgi:CheY-like chemotaxis protein